MARMDEAPTPDILYTETANASIVTPASGNQKLFVDTDHLLKLKNSSGTVTSLAPGMANVLTTTGDIIYSSSGTTAARRAIGSSGDVLTVAGGVPTWAAAGGVTFYGARAINTATQNISDTTITALAFNSETAPGFDVGSVHDTVTNNSRFTVPTGGNGKWSGAAGGIWDTNTAGGVGRLMWWRLNGTTDIPGSSSHTNGNTAGRYQQAVCPALLLADADYVEIVVYQDSGGTRVFGVASLVLGSSSASFYRVA